MTVTKSPRRRGVVVTPALRYGSWTWLEDVIRHSVDVSWVVVGYGRVPDDPPCNARFVTLPGGDYLKIGRFAARPVLLWLNVLYALPLALLAAVVSRRERPDVIVGNGIAATALLQACRVVSPRSRIWLAYHGYIAHLHGVLRWMIRFMLAGATGAVCNSQGNASELRPVVPHRPVVPVEHWADDAYFEGTVRQAKSVGVLQVLFVGRTDPAKFAQCRRVCTLLAQEGLSELTVIGPVPNGEQEPGINYIGYVYSKDELRSWYQRADVTWAPADVDYLSRPGVEALASGCPVVVSDIPAVEGKCDGTVRIPRTLVPQEAGAVVDGMDDHEVLELLRGWAQGGLVLGDREACRRYGKERFSSANIQGIENAWFAA